MTNNVDLGQWDSSKQDFTNALNKKEFLIEYRKYQNTQDLIEKLKTTNPGSNEYLKLTKLIDNGKKLDKILIRGMAKYGIDITNLDISDVTDLSYTFFELELFNQDISKWDTSNVTNMSYLFDSCQKFNSNLSSWNVSNVKDMSYMFFNCINFNQDISNWDTSNVVTMSGMFNRSEEFNCDIGDWDVSKCTDFTNLFYSCYKFNHYIGDWNIKSSVNKDTIFTINFDIMNNNTRYTKYRLLKFINKYKLSTEDLKEQNKYELMIYLKNFSEIYPIRLKELIISNDIKEDINIF
jgi:surface protein